MSYPVLMVPAGDVIPIMFGTYAGATGASITMTGLAVTDIEIYKDGGVTQRASDAGYTLLDTDGIDFDGITGIHGFSINTGDDTDAGFYTVGAWFTVVVSAVTVDGQTVNFIAAMFRLMEEESVPGVPMVDAGYLDGDFVGASIAEAVWSAPKASYVDAGSFGEEVQAHALTSEVAAVETDTQDIQARLPAALVGGRIDATVDATGMEAGATAAIADAVLDEALSGHVAAGSLGKAVADIEADTNELQVDDYPTTLAAILADTNELQTDWVNGGRLDLLIDAILADTGTDGVVISAATANQIADAILKRDWDSVTGEAARSALNALRILRNKRTVAGATLTVYEEDDTTPAWTAAVTTAAGDPATGVDPA